MTDQPEVPTLTLDDLQVVESIIAAGSARGMYKPEELTTVGVVYNKVNAILEDARAKAREMIEAQEAQVNTEEGETDGD